MGFKLGMTPGVNPAHTTGAFLTMALTIGTGVTLVLPPLAALAAASFLGASLLVSFLLGGRKAWAGASVVQTRQAAKVRMPTLHRPNRKFVMEVASMEEPFAVPNRLA